MTWHYKNKPLTKPPENKVGMVYLITELDTNKQYIGIKKFWKKTKLKPLKGKKRKRTSIKESDWRTYQTSSPIMQNKLSNNPNNYHKTILKLCDTISEMKAYEAYQQLKTYFEKDWNMLYNEIVNLRVRLRKKEKDGEIRQTTTGNERTLKKERRF